MSCQYFYLRVTEADVDSVGSEVKGKEGEGEEELTPEGEKEEEQVKEREGKRGGEGERPEGEGDSSESGEEEEEEEREDREVVMVEVGKPEWDCESILRYYIMCCILPIAFLLIEEVTVYITKVNLLS